MTRGPEPTEKAVRRYRRPLSLLPRRYLSEAADELCRVLADEHAEARRCGPRGVAVIWHRVVLDTVMTASGEWWACLRENGSGGMARWIKDMHDSFKCLARRPGRWFDGSDRGDTEAVAIVNESFARTRLAGR